MDDLAACSDAQAAVETLRARQAAELIFTRLGTQLVALTPARPLPALFSRAELQRYRTLERLLPPHVFEVGARALSTAATDGSCECIVFIGGGAAGKTYLAHRTLEQLCALSAGAAALEAPLLASSDVHELFRADGAILCRAASLYYAPDGRVGAARVHAVLFGRDALLVPPPAGAEGRGALRAFDALERSRGTSLVVPPYAR